MTILVVRKVIFVAALFIALAQPAVAQHPVEALTVRAGQSVALATYRVRWMRRSSLLKAMKKLLDGWGLC